MMTEAATARLRATAAQLVVRIIHPIATGHRIGITQPVQTKNRTRSGAVSLEPSDPHHPAVCTTSCGT